MDMMKQGNEKEFSFIQEKVVSRRKHRIRKFLISFLATLFLAVIFGIVARIAFIKSDFLLFQFLGIDEERRQQLLFPSNGPDDSSGLGLTPTPEPTSTEEPTKGVDDGNNSEEPGGEQNGESGEKTPQITVVEQKIAATLKDYQNIYTEMRKLVSTLNYSLVTVTAVESGVDWFNDAYETRKFSTGVVMGEDNVDLLILTSLDKVENADSIEITFYGNLSVPGTLWSYDKDYNLAVIAVDIKNIPNQQLKLIKPPNFGESYALSIGTPIIALGNPNGYAGSMEIGMITSKGSAVYTTDNKLDLFNTDIADIPESDGIIINLNGDVIGIITHSLKEDMNSNINTVIGISKLKPIIQSLANKEDQIYFGIKGEDIPTNVLKEVEIENGIYVTEVLADSPAFHAGIRQGDIITMVNESKVNSMNGFASILGTYKVNESVTISLQRRSKQELVEKQFEAILQKKYK